MFWHQLNNYPIYNFCVQEKDITNPDHIAEKSPRLPEGRIIALDPGTKRVGIAVCDELQMTVRPLPFIERHSWKRLLIDVLDTLTEFDAKALVIGLPYNFDGSESEMSAEARQMAAKFELSLEMPVFLQDERATSYEAKGRLWNAGVSRKATRRRVDSEAAAIILEDFLDRMKRNEGA
jgi:putative Holliday junction resolvase